MGAVRVARRRGRPRSGNVWRPRRPRGNLGGTTGDGQADGVVVNGTNGNDAVTVNGDAGGIKESGLAASVEVLHAEAANDSLEINTLAGRDSVDSRGLAPNTIKLAVNGVSVP